MDDLANSEAKVDGVTAARETVESFVCPNCGSENFVRWSAGERTRSVACSTCYREDWRPVLDLREVPQPPASELVQVAQEKIVSGQVLLVERGRGARIVDRALPEVVDAEAERL